MYTGHQSSVSIHVSYISFLSRNTATPTTMKNLYLRQSFYYYYFLLRFFERCLPRTGYIKSCKTTVWYKKIKEKEYKGVPKWYYYIKKHSSQLQYNAYLYLFIHFVNKIERWPLIRVRDATGNL